MQRTGFFSGMMEYLYPTQVNPTPENDKQEIIFGVNADTTISRRYFEMLKELLPQYNVSFSIAGFNQPLLRNLSTIVIAFYSHEDKRTDSGIFGMDGSHSGYSRLPNTKLYLVEKKRPDDITAAGDLAKISTERHVVWDDTMDAISAARLLADKINQNMLPKLVR